jgi:hypothetical protein
MGETLKNSGIKFLFFPQFFHLNGFIKGGKKKIVRAAFKGGSDPSPSGHDPVYSVSLAEPALKKTHLRDFFASGGQEKNFHSGHGNPKTDLEDTSGPELQPWIRYDSMPIYG